MDSEPNSAGFSSAMNDPGSIGAVTFDVGGTLIEPWPSVGHVYAEVAARHGMKGIAAATLDARFRAVWRENRDFNYTRGGWEKLVEQTFRGLAVAPAWSNFFSELYERFAEADAWQVFDDVRPTLEALASRGLRLGVISNWDDRLRVLLRRLRLDSYFETLTISCEVGFAKPSPVIFQEAMAKLGLPPEAMLHVGDDDRLDVHGALSAGFQAVRLVRNGEGCQPGDIASLAELVARAKAD